MIVKTPASRELSPSWGIWIWLLSVVLVAIAALVLTLAALGVAVVSGLSLSSAGELLFGRSGASPLITSPAWILAAIVVNELAVLASVSLGTRGIKSKLADVLPRPKTSGSKLAASVALVFGLAPLAQLSAELMSRLLERERYPEEVVRTLGQETNAFLFLVALAFVGLLPALCEEALFRGFLMRCFERLGVATSILVTSLLFALLHLEPSQIAGTFVLGLGFGFVRWATGSIVPCVLSHAFYNAAVVASARLTPDGDARAIEPFAIALGLIVSAVAAWWLRRPHEQAR
jgi:membrane protease YdiL (CAAX protease family)